MNFQMRYIAISIICLVLLVLFYACGKEEKYPIEPVIAFKSIEPYNKAEFKFVISFTDGDGDIGLSDEDQNKAPFNDSSSIYYYNLYVYLSRKTDGVFTPIDFGNSLPYHNRIKDITPDERNKNIKGEITYAPIGLVLGKNYFKNPTDTFKVDVFIFDRALHQSNTVSSPEFVMINPG